MSEIKRIIELVKNKSHRQIIENFFSLSVLNILNLLLPLITLPYLVRILGPEKYGTVSFVLVIFQYITMVSNYGFSFSATKLISQNRNDINKISTFFNSIIHIKFIISFVSLIILTILILIIPKLQHEYILYIMCLGIVLGDIMNPTWLFQGMEKMKYLTITNFISKITFTLLIFVFVTKVSDYPYVCLLTSIGYLLSGFISMIIAISIFKIKILLPKKGDYLFQLKEGWYIFVSTIGMTFYRNGNILILGIFTNDSVVGLYSAAEKIIKAAQSPISPVSEALFPFFSKKFSSIGKQNSIDILFKLGKYYFYLLSLISVLIIIFAPFLVNLLLGKEFLTSVVDVQIMGFVILFGGLNYLFGIIGLVNLNYNSLFAKIVFIGGIITVLMCSILSPFIKDIGASMAFLSGEIVIFILIYTTLIKKKRIALAMTSI